MCAGRRQNAGGTGIAGAPLLDRRDKGRISNAMNSLQRVIGSRATRSLTTVAASELGKLFKIRMKIAEDRHGFGIYESPRIHDAVQTPFESLTWRSCEPSWSARFSSRALLTKIFCFRAWSWLKVQGSIKQLLLKVNNLSELRKNSSVSQGF